ncbi:Phosphohydrolase (MutT/nudix family protein) [Alkalibacterium sp. AK22]|uniref:NUDIX hydrolase n=1 Tax=Alkalibacterium sp. AK22 TaxID=1229520 RepID=UPI000447BB1B|nr:CoA pyrophosphatase [Alkalibacterium sp. AK22]EXJ23489.1 Phosphohydrolase (MutT/nudix family protein) [Alkalibacterium sp. AK22]
MWKEIEKALKEYDPKQLGQQKQFAVLLPLVETDGQMNVLFEKRSRSVSQPNETSFPGGAVEVGETYEEAAVRETSEELNVKPDRIKIIGEIDFIAAHSHVIRCFVGKLSVESIDEIQPNEEVSEVFTLPLERLLNLQPEYHAVKMKVEHKEDFPFDLIANGQRHKWMSARQLIPFYRLPDQYLWGYTAQFMHRFVQIMKAQKSADTQRD